MPTKAKSSSKKTIQDHKTGTKLLEQKSSTHAPAKKRSMLRVTAMEGFDKLRKNHHDLVLSDVMIPKMDGFRFCEMVRNDVQLKMTPIDLWGTSKTQI